MSDILIKNMKMPKNCAECQFSDVFEYPPDYYAEWICELNYISMSWEDAQIRNSNCPLIEVPTPHGKLIDADELYKCAELRSEQFNGHFNDLDNVINALYIKTFPTVIPAEPSKEETDD